MYKHIKTHRHIPTYTYTDLHTYIHIYIYTFLFTYIYMYIYICVCIIYTCIYIYIHTSIRPSIHPYTHTDRDRQTDRQAGRQTDRHTTHTTHNTHNTHNTQNTDNTHKHIFIYLHIQAFGTSFSFCHTVSNAVMPICTACPKFHFFFSFHPLQCLLSWTTCWLGCALTCYYVSFTKHIYWSNS